MRHNIFKIACGLFAAMVFTACSNDDSFHPGEDVAEGVVGAFFDKANATDFSFETEDPLDSIVLKVDRTDSTSYAKVPLKVTCDTTAISVPDTVVFEAGKSQTDLIVRIDRGLYTDIPYSFTIEIDSASISPYAAGLPVYTASILKGNPWKVIAKDAEFYFNDKSCPLPTMYSDICQYKNSNRFRIDDFMGSGTDLEFTLTGDFDGSDINTYAGEFAWNADQVYHADNGYDYIYATDENGEFTYDWTIDGCDVGINAFAGYMGQWSYIVFDNQDYEEGSRNYMYFFGFCDLSNGSAINAYFYGVW